MGRRVQSWHPAQQYTVKSQCQLWYVTASFVSSSFKTQRLIFIGPPNSLWHQPQCNCLETPDLLDLDYTNEDVDTELLSLLNPQSGDSKWVRGCATHRSHCWWLQLWPHCCTLPPSLCDGQQICPGSSMSSLSLWNLSSGGDSSLLWNMNSSVTGRWEWGHPGPLAMMHCSVIAWAINCWLSCRLNGLALSWVCLATQLLAPDSVNMVSLVSPKFRPSPRDHLP